MECNETPHPHSMMTSRFPCLSRSINLPLFRVTIGSLLVFVLVVAVVGSSPTVSLSSFLLLLRVVTIGSMLFVFFFFVVLVVVWSVFSRFSCSVVFCTISTLSSYSTLDIFTFTVVLSLLLPFVLLFDLR